jgi:hypothetical protein
MADKKGTKRNKLLIIAGTVFAVLVVVYFVVTSGAFIKGVVLPKVADALKSDLTVEDLSVSPFSGVDLKGVTLTPKGREVLVAVGAVRVRYSAPIRPATSRRCLPRSAAGPNQRRRPRARRRSSRFRTSKSPSFWSGRLRRPPPVRS